MGQKRNPNGTKWHFALNENKNMAYQNTLNATNAVPRQKCTAIKSVYEKDKFFKIVISLFSSKKPGK